MSEADAFPWYSAGYSADYSFLRIHVLKTLPEYPQILPVIKDGKYNFFNPFDPDPSPPPINSPLADLGNILGRNQEHLGQDAESASA